MKSIFVVFLVLWGALLSAQSGELVGTFSVQSSTGSDPTPTVVGFFNSTLGYFPGNIGVGNILAVRQVYSGNDRFKLYRITGVSGNAPLTLNTLLIYGTPGGPFPSGVQEITTMTVRGSLYDAPNVSQELESRTMNYTINNLESSDIDTVITSNDSLYLRLNSGQRFFVGFATAGGGGGGGATNLGYTANPTNGFITSSTGAGTTIPQATPSNINQVGGSSGVVSNADKYRIDNATLIVQGSGGVDVTSTTSSNPIAKTATVSLAPAAANTIKANATATSSAPTDVAIGASQLLGRGSTGNIAPITLGTNLTMSGTTLNASGAGGMTDLGYVASPTNGTVTSTTGTSATIPAVNGTNAGLATPSMFTLSHNPVTVTDGPLVDFSITGQSISATVPTNAVDNTIISDMPGNTVKANNTSSTGDPVDVALSANQLFGRGSSGNLGPITLGTNLNMSGSTLNATGGTEYSYRSTDNFATTTPSSVSFPPNIGSLAVDQRRGSLWHGPTLSTRVTLDNGLAATSVWSDIVSPFTFDPATHNRTLFQPSASANDAVANPALTSGIDPGETFLICLENLTGSSDTVTWGSSWRTKTGTAFPTTILAASDHQCFSFRVTVMGGSTVLASDDFDGVTSVGAISGIDYVTQATAPLDTTKFWLDNSKTLEWPLRQRIRGSWQIVGWYVPIANHFSSRKPIKELTTGQSNAQNRGGGSLNPLDPRVLENISGTTWVQANWSSMNNIGYQFAYNLAKNEDRVVFHRTIAQASRPIEDWYPDSARYNEITAWIAMNNIDEVDVVNFRQGEANSADTEAQYALKVRTVINGLRALPQFRNTIFVMGAMNEFYWGTGPYDFYNHLNNPENAVTGVVGVNMDGLSLVSGIHVDGPSIDTVGYRYYRAYRGEARQYSLNKTPFVNWLSQNELRIFPDHINANALIRLTETNQGRRGGFIGYNHASDQLVIGGNPIVNGARTDDRVGVNVNLSGRIGIGAANSTAFGNTSLFHIRVPPAIASPFAFSIGNYANNALIQIDTNGQHKRPINMLDAVPNSGAGNIWLRHTSANSVESGRARFTKNNGSATWIGFYVHHDGLNNVFWLGSHPTNDTLIANDTPTLGFYRGATGLLFGGTSSSFPYLLRTGNKLQMRLADNSGFSNLEVALNPYNAATWNGNQEVPTKDDVRDALEARTLPSGTIGQTIRHNGTAWVANDRILNNGTSVTVDGSQLEVRNTAGAGQNASPILFREDIDNIGGEGISVKAPDALSANFVQELTPASGSIAVYLQGSGNLDFPTVSGGASQQLTITVSGAVNGDEAGPVGVTASAHATGLVWTATVTSANTVTVNCFNSTATPIDPSSGTFKVKVWK